jgi:iron complex transport system substrate-binding protein
VSSDSRKGRQSREGGSPEKNWIPGQARNDIRVVRHSAMGIALLLFFIPIWSCPVSLASEPPKRIISLAPNMTEILFALGLGDRLVGVTSFCDYPPEAKTKPKIGGMSNPSLEAVVRLRPDIVVMTTDGNSKEFEERLRSMGIRTFVSRARRLSELPEGVRELGAALGVEKEADAFADNFEKELAKAGARHSRKEARRKKVLFIVWPDPLIVAGPGTVIDDALALVGAENIASDAKSEYPKYSIEEVLRRSPDLIIVGKAMDSTDVKKVAAGLLRRLRSLRAVREKKVFFVSDDLYRLGPRTLKGIAEISPLMDER